MRRYLPACRTGLTVAVALVALSGCSASDGAEPAPTEAGPAAAGASEGTGGRADPEFCTAATALQEQVATTLGAQPDPAAVQTALQQAAAGFRAVEPPEEIATDWHTLGDDVERIATALATTDVQDPGGRAALEEQVGQLQARVGPASTNVGAYLREECGIDAGGSDPATPSD